MFKFSGPSRDALRFSYATGMIVLRIFVAGIARILSLQFTKIYLEYYTNVSNQLRIR